MFRLSVLEATKPVMAAAMRRGVAAFTLCSQVPVPPRRRFSGALENVSRLRPSSGFVLSSSSELNLESQFKLLAQGPLRKQRFGKCRASSASASSPAPGNGRRRSSDDSTSGSSRAPGNGRSAPLSTGSSHISGNGRRSPLFSENQVSENERNSFPSGSSQVSENERRSSSSGSSQVYENERSSSSSGSSQVYENERRTFSLSGSPQVFGNERRTSSSSGFSESSENGRSSSPSGSPGNGRKSSLRARGVEVRGQRGSEGVVENFFATCSPGLEEIVAAELRSSAIGASRVQIGSAGVSFCGTKCTGVAANLWLRSATRVLLELASGPLPKFKSGDPVYDFVRQATDWPTILVDDCASNTPPVCSLPRTASGGARELESDKGRKQRWKFRTFSVNARVRDCEGVTSSMFATVRAKDAICDALRDACGGLRPDPPEDGSSSADVPLFFSLYRDNAVLYRDMTGISLHKRGYRDVMHRAGLNEAIAAAMLTVAGWNRWLPEIVSSNKGPGGNARVLMDPMCGSGTLLIEAALMAINSAPGLMRSHWPFETWHDFSPSLLKGCRNEAIAAEVSAPKGLRLLGNDIHEGALSLCLRDAEAANVRPMLELSCKDCRDYSPPVSPSLVVVNPPWGERLGDSRDSEDSQSLLTTWQALGRFLKTHCSQADVYVLSGNSSVTHAMHMKADKKWPVSVGGIDCRIMHYHVLPPKTPTSLDSVLAIGNI